MSGPRMPLWSWTRHKIAQTDFKFAQIPGAWRLPVREWALGTITCSENRRQQSDCG